MATQAKRLLPGLVAVAVLAGCATGTTVSGSGGPEPAAVTGAVTPAPAAPQSGEASESRQVSGFTGVELTAIGDLDTPVRQPIDGKHLSTRWVLTHMAHETARHAGHADILREQIDGTTGR